jgi:hypothetical protein
MRVSGFRSRLIFRRRGGGREVLDVVGVPTQRCSAEAPPEQPDNIELLSVDGYSQE